MREIAPQIKAGQPIRASYLNEISTPVEKLGRFKTGSYLTGRNTKNLIDVSGLPQDKLIVVRISSNKIVDSDSEDSGYYACNEGWFDFSNNTWRWDGNHEWWVDFSVWGIGGGIEVGSIHFVKWDIQRGFFVPLLTELIRPARLTEALTYGSSADAYFLEGEDRSEQGAGFTVYDIPRFITVGSELVATTIIRVQWDILLKKWVLLTSSVCESTIA